MRNLRFKNVWLVAKREYLERVKTKAFVIATLVAPVLIAAIAIGPSKIMLSKAKGDRKIVVVASDATLAGALQKRLQAPSDTKDADSISGIRYYVSASSDLSDANRRRLQSQIDAHEIDGFLWVDGNALATHKVDYFARQTSDFIELGGIRKAVRDSLTTWQFEQNGVSSEKLKQFLSPVELNITQWLNGVGKKNEEGQFAVIFVLEFAMYIVTLMYGMNVLRSVITEKTSRILEVLLSSLTPSELMSGKIFGVGAAGLTQVAIWALTATVLSSPMAVMLASVVGQSTFNPAIAACFIAFFLLGFLLYSSLCAAVGSMVSAEQEAQQFQFLITAPMMLSFFFVFFAIRAPNDPLVVALSMFPFSAPIVMFARIVLGAASKSQIGISIAVMVATIAFVIWLCGRIYRVGVLMYGKRPTLPEILKWIRYA